jgi:Domain of unknown function (DUF4345)
MRDLPVYFAIAGFFAMGIGAIAKPHLVTAQFDILDLTAAGRNEVRAVYGGFGVMTAVALLVALQQPELRPGVFLAVAAALSGMAGGRMVSAVIDRAIDKWPLRYLLLELVVATMLLATA